MQQQQEEVPLFRYPFEQSGERRRRRRLKSSGYRPPLLLRHERRIPLDQLRFIDPQSFRYNLDTLFTFNRMLASLKNAQDSIHAVNSALQRPGFGLLDRVVQRIIQEARSRRFQPHKCARTRFPYKRIGVLSCRQGNDLDAHSAVHKEIQPAQCSPHARRIGIEQQDDVLGEPPQSLNMLRGQGGAQGGHRMRKPRLVQRYRIKIAFDDNDRLGPNDRLTSLIERKERLSLLKQKRVGRIQIFGHAVAQHTTAESHDSLAQIGDREHDSRTKPIVEPGPAVSSHHEPGCSQIASRKPLLREGFDQAIPFGRGDTDPKPVDRVRMNASTLQILTPDSAGPRIMQCLCEPGRSSVIELLNPLRLPPLGPGVGGDFFNLDPHLPSKLADNLGKTRAGDTSDKCKHIPTGPAAETMKNLF